MLSFIKGIPPILSLNTKPQKVKNDCKSNRNDCDSHVKFIKVILEINKKDQCVNDKIEKVILMEHNKKFKCE